MSQEQQPAGCAPSVAAGDSKQVDMFVIGIAKHPDDEPKDYGGVVVDCSPIQWNISGGKVILWPSYDEEFEKTETKCPHCHMKPDQPTDTFWVHFCKVKKTHLAVYKNIAKAVIFEPESCIRRPLALFVEDQPEYRHVKEMYICECPPDFVHSGSSTLDITGKLHTKKK
jgi:hypothetical protein